MPKRTDIKSILILGAGLFKGQACEFDYSGAQACKALLDEGYRVILVNLTSDYYDWPVMADGTYIDRFFESSWKNYWERAPDALLPTRVVKQH